MLPQPWIMVLSRFQVGLDLYVILRWALRESYGLIHYCLLSKVNTLHWRGHDGCHPSPCTRTRWEPLWLGKPRIVECTRNQVLEKSHIQVLSALRQLNLVVHMGSTLRPWVSTTLSYYQIRFVNLKHGLVIRTSSIMVPQLSLYYSL